MLSKTFTHITRIVKLSLTYTALFSSGLAATGSRRGGGGHVGKYRPHFRLSKSVPNLSKICVPSTFRVLSTVHISHKMQYVSHFRVAEALCFSSFYYLLFSISFGAPKKTVKISCKY